MAWQVFAYGAMVGGSAAIGWLRRRYGPKSDRLKPQDFGDNAGQPFAQPGQIWPVFTGTAKIDGGQLLWFGAKHGLPIGANGAIIEAYLDEYSSMPWEDTLTQELPGNVVGLAYRGVFRIGFGVPLGGGGGALRRLWINDRVVWSGRKSSGTITIGDQVYRTLWDASVWDAGDNEVEVAHHGLNTGDGPLFLHHEGDGAAPGLPTGLDDTTPYWAIRIGASSIAFASSRANALALTKINFDAAPVNPNGHIIITARPLLPFDPSDVNTGADTITIPDHGLLTGHGPVRVGSTGEAPSRAPLGVSPINDLDLWVIKVDDDTIQLATSYGAAVSENAIDLQTQGSGSHRLFTQPSVEHFFGPNGGRLRGTIEIRGGSATQGRPEMLVDAYAEEAGMDGKLPPANRRLCELIFGSSPNDHFGLGFDMGSQPQMFRVAAEWEALPTFGAEGDVGPFNTYQVGDSDASIATTIWQLLTNRFSGLGRPVADYDQDSFEEVADLLVDEGNGVSMVWGLANGLRDAVDEILDQADLHLRFNPSTGKVELLAIRPGDISGKPRFDQDNVDDVKITRPTWEECVNQVDLHYPDRAREHRDHVPATAIDQGLLSGPHDGEVRPLDIHYTGVRVAAQASALALRELHGANRPIRTAQIFTNRDGANGFLTGDVVVLDWPDEGIADLPFCVANIHYGELDDPKVVIDAVENEFHQQQGSGFPAAEVPPKIITTPPQPVTVHGVAEAWRWLLVKAGATDPDFAARAYILAKDPGPSANGFRPWLSKNAGVTYALDKNPMPFCAYAELELDLLRTEEPYDTSSYIQVENLVTPNGIADGSVIAQLLTTTQISVEGRNLVIIGDPADPDGHEICAFEDVTGLGTANYQLGDPWRGLFDTVPRHWPAGTPVWFLGAVKLTVLGNLVFEGNATLMVKLPTRGAFTEMHRDDAPEIDVQFTRRALRPYPPAKFRLRQDRGAATGTDTNDLTDEDAHPTMYFGDR